MNASLIEDFRNNEIVYHICTFVVGLVTTAGMSVCMAFTSLMALQFDKFYLFSVFSIFLMALSCIARYLNARVWINVPHQKRIFANCCIILLSNVLFTFSIFNINNIWGFYLGVLACIFHQFSSAFGEAVVMGYLKGLPSDLVITFGSGTGLAGFCDVFTILFIQALSLQTGKIFTLMTMLVIPYFVCFMWLDDKRQRLSKAGFYPKGLTIMTPDRLISQGLEPAEKSPVNSAKSNKK